AKNINVSVYPVNNKQYKFILRIKTVDITEERINFFPTVTSITYRQIDTKMLIVESIKKIAEAYERKNFALFSRQISRDFLGNKNILEEGVRYDFDMFNNIRLAIFINRIAKSGKLYLAETSWNKTQTSRKTMNEQKTKGKTNFIFILEDGLMKIQNLRGNLIYATLSPEIAQSSGLSQNVIEEIRIAKRQRKTTQPGAAETVSGDEDNDDPISPTPSPTPTPIPAADTNSSNIVSGTMSMKQSAAHVPFTNQTFTFSTQTVSTEELPPGSTNGDFKREEGYLTVKSGHGIKNLGSVSIASVTEAPSSGYSTGQIEYNSNNNTFAISLGDGTYALFQPTSESGVVAPSNIPPLSQTTTYKYKYQKNGTRSFQ
ncbi:hypothetical protein KAJ27_15795, partial [bacterium]|nr:hypothetical protein [bacterium]